MHKPWTKIIVKALGGGRGREEGSMRKNGDICNKDSNKDKIFKKNEVSLYISYVV